MIELIGSALFMGLIWSSGSLLCPRP